MSSKLTFEEALKIRYDEPVYVVTKWVGLFTAMPARIIGWRSWGPLDRPEIKVKLELDGAETYVYPDEIYTDAQECYMAAEATQKKYGRVSISQAEYDELLAIKKAYEAMTKGSEQDAH